MSSGFRLLLTIGCPLAVWLTAPSAGIAQEADGLSVDVGECVELESATERYACYDRQVEAAQREGAAALPAEASPPASVPEPPAPPGSVSEDVPPPSAAARTPAPTAPAASADDPADRFGLEQEVSPEPPEQIVAAIAELDELLPNEYLITLDNGQVWRQMRSRRYPLRVGHEVTIYPTQWGTSYRMSSEELNGFIQVERIR